MAGCSSIFILTSLTAPLAERTAFSRTGVSCLHGPHHGAQKSTRTGWWRDSSITSFLKVCVVVSLTRPSAVAAATPTFIQVDLSCLRKSQEAPYRLWLNGEQRPDCNRDFKTPPDPPPQGGTVGRRPPKRFRCVAHDR